MILLNLHSIDRVRKVPVEKMSLNLKEKDSTASMTPADMTGISVGSWLLDDTEPGAGIGWRVRSIRTAYAEDTATVELEHLVSTLKDRILPGETTPATITGNKKATTCTAEQAVRFILSKQSDWVLGSFDYGQVTGAYKFDGDSLYDALETVSGTLDDSWWSFDFTKYPFRLHINMKSTAVESELRPGRNLHTITRTVETGGMYTRLYPIGKEDLQLSGTGYVEKNTQIYGVIEHTETESSCTTDAELRQWAILRLAKHCEPTVNIEIDGLELADATGVSMDRLTLGRICRVPLWEFGTTITERIVSLNYPDKVNTPESVRVTLANNKDDVTRIIADAIKKGGRGGRAAGRQEKEDHAWFEDTEEHVAMVAEGIVGRDANGNPNWTRLSQIIVDENGIDSSVTSLWRDMVLAQTRITQTEYDITLRATKGEMETALRVASDQIYGVVRDTAANLQSSIDVQKDRISLVVEGTGANAKINPAKIVASINNGQSNILINADHIRLSGTTKLNDVMVVTGGAAGFKKPAIFQGNVDINSTGKLNLYTAVFQGSNPITLNAVTLKDVIKSAIVSGNVLTLVPMTGDPITFSKATSLSGAWSSNTYTVTAKQNTTTVATLSETMEIRTNGNPSLDPLVANAIVVPVKLVSGSQETERWTKDLTVAVLSLLETPSTYTTNGTKNPSSDKLGFKQVKINIVPSNFTVSSSSQGTSLGTLSGATPGKYLRLKCGGSDYYLLLT